MDTNMTFRMDSEVKAQMGVICSQLGMTTSTAFNIFANAFVRAKGMPFAVTIPQEPSTVSREKMLADTDQLLAEFASDYKMNGCATIDSARPFRFLADKAAVAADFHLRK